MSEIPESENEERTLHDPPKAELTDMGWEVYPEGLYDLMMRVHQDYAPASVYITENGAAFPDQIEPDGTIRDAHRQQYFESHLAQLHRAIERNHETKCDIRQDFAEWHRR